MTGLSSRYNLSASPDWQALLTHFELGRGFAFIVLLVPNQDGAEVCREALSQYLSGRGQQLREISVASPADLRNIADPLLDLHASADTGAIWVARAVPEAVPEFPVWQDAWREGVARLNQFRNPLRRQFEIPLIFVGAPWLQEVLRESAPDLWSVRTLVTWVEPQAIVSERPGFSLDSTGPTRGPDPELALAEANRLRGKRGAEGTLARLLGRAGLGFAARYQWAEAVKALSESLETLRRSGALPQAIALTGRQLAIALMSHADYDGAMEVLTEVRAKYLSLPDAGGVAACTEDMGDLELRRGDHEGARRQYEEALVLYRGVGDRLGQANCLYGLSNVAFYPFDLGTAQMRAEGALALYREVGDVSGQANCLKRLGRIAEWRADYETASAHYERALQVCARAGDASGQAACVLELGHLAFCRSDLIEARRLYEKALRLYGGVGDSFGAANCTAAFGEIAAMQGNVEEAKEHYHAAIDLYARLGSLFSVGRTFALLSHVSYGEERAAYLEKARSAFQAIGRQDLIENLEKEFPKPPATAPK